MEKKVNYSKELSEIIEDAKELAEKGGYKWIYPEHLALSLVKKYCGDGVSVGDLESNPVFLSIGGIKLSDIESDISDILKTRVPNEDVNENLWKYGIQLSPESTQIFDRVINAGPEDLLRGLLGLDGNLGSLLRTKYKIELPENSISNFDNAMAGILDFLKEMTGGNVKIKKLDQGAFSFGNDDDDEASEAEKLATSKDVADKDLPFLSKYGYNMVEAAKSGKFDPMVGREAELQELIEILSCRKKNNAVLLGDPGTGKTSIIEGLAQRIADSNVPLGLLGKKLYSLDLNGLVAGTKYRGQYEERLAGIIKEVTSRKDIIIYIDEFHNLVGNGSSSGSGDGANILKPYLARGEFQCIGATTMTEYKKHIEKDGALKRRFQNVIVREPSMDDTFQILSNIKEKYEEFHGVSYDDEVLRSCINLADRFVIDRFFPDKAIDIMDMAGARAKLDSPRGDISRIKAMENTLEALREKKAEAVKNQAFEEAARIRDAEKDLLAKIDSEKNPKNHGDVVTMSSVASVIEKLTGVPASKLGQSEMARLRSMKEVLENIVIGQPEAIMDVVKSLQRNALGLRDPKKPIASLMMIGPTGSGKTYLSKIIAKEFFGTQDALIRFDMSEFTERHEVTKLIGSTASYVGYEDEPLFEKVRNRPHSVVLFDEIEKAAPEIYQIFLNILDEGSITLGNGKQVSFRNCLIIFTGNIGTKELGLGKIGFDGGELNNEEIESVVKKALKKTFSPEFINRLTKTTVFRKLTDEDLSKICVLEIKKFSERLATQGYSLDVDKGVIKKIVEVSDKLYGARDIQRGITKYIETPVADKLLEDGVEGKNIKVELDNVTIN